VMSGFSTPGGRALKFYSSCRIDVRRIGQLKDGEEVVGQRVRAKVVKNKVAPPFRIAEFDMMHTNGISMEGDVLDLAVDRNIVNKSGSWFKYNDTHIGQGKEKARAFLVENPDITAELRRKVFESDGLAATDAEVAEATAKDAAKDAAKADSAADKEKAKTAPAANATTPAATKNSKKDVKKAAK